jgi:hypothetical protein
VKRRRWIITLVVCALVLVGCRSGAEEAPAEVGAPVAPVVAEQPAQAVEVQPRERVEPVGQVEPVGALDPESGSIPDPTATPRPTLTEVSVTDEALETEGMEEQVAEAEADFEAEAAEPDEAPTSTPVTVQRPVIPLPATRPPARVVSTSALIVLDDETPAPPLTVLVSMNRAFEGYRFRISGLVRNDADEPYTGLWMNATFFRDDGSRYGPVRVNVQCPILEPGESCPFLLGATDKAITQVMLHPDGHPTDRRTVPVELRGIGRTQDALGYVHITGTVTNPNPVTVRDVTITGVLIDQLGEIVEVGVDLLVLPLEAGASAPFEVLIRHAPYVRYQLFVQALPR